jgi:hypothetical protein
MAYIISSRFPQTTSFDMAHQRPKAWIFCDKLDNIVDLRYTNDMDMQDFLVEFHNTYKELLGREVSINRLILLKLVSPVSFHTDHPISRRKQLVYQAHYFRTLCALQLE